MQYLSLDAFERRNANYVDGVSITHGSPRKHIWTLAGGLSQDVNYSTYNCPCAQYPGPSPPSFVGNDYYCDTAMKGQWQSNAYWSKERLWDGHCYSKSNCCNRSGMPFFVKKLKGETTEAIEVRLCINEGLHNENLGLEEMQLFVR